MTLWLNAPTKQAQLNAAINEQVQKYIGGELLRLVEFALDGVCDCRVDDAPFVIDINYAAAFPDAYLRSEVRLEIGPLALWLPLSKLQLEFLRYVLDELTGSSRYQGLRVGLRWDPFCSPRTGGSDPDRSTDPI